MSFFGNGNKKKNDVDLKTSIETIQIENRKLLNKIRNNLNETKKLLLLKDKCTSSEEKNNYLVLIQSNLDEVKKLKSQIENNKLEIKRLENNK